MKFKSLIFSILTTLSLLVASTVLADQSKDPPTCPSVSHLQKSIFVVSAPTPGDSTTWLVLQPPNHYGTSQTWLFGLAVYADDRFESYKNAYKALSRLGNSAGAYNVLGVWFCDYPAGMGTGGQARIINL